MPQHHSQPDISFIRQYNWSVPDEDINKALEIVSCDGKHKHEPCPAAREDYQRVSWALAAHPETPPAVLDHISTHSNHLKLLERIAANCNIGRDTLKRLARHQSSEIRQAVAEHHQLDDETVDLLKRDAHTDVRYSLAENHTVPPEILTELSADENPYVAHRAETTRRRALAPHAAAPNLNHKSHTQPPLKRAL